VETNNNDDTRLTGIELTMLASNFIVAGSGTSAGGMSGLTYLLLRSPDKLAKLQKEIRDTFKTQDEITMLNTAHCKYLDACINEGLRVYPPTPNSLPRIVPGKGEVIDGKWIPGGIAVGTNQLACGHSELNFHRAKDFLPERWLDLEPGSPFERDEKASINPFSVGQRSCIGKA
jgi:cytochrome P450